MCPLYEEGLSPLSDTQQVLHAQLSHPVLATAFSHHRMRCISDAKHKSNVVGCIIALCVTLFCAVGIFNSSSLYPHLHRLRPSTYKCPTSTQSASCRMFLFFLIFETFLRSECRQRIGSLFVNRHVLYNRSGLLSTPLLY